MQVEDINDLIGKLFDIKMNRQEFGELTITIKAGRVVHVKKGQDFKEKGEVRRR